MGKFLLIALAACSIRGPKKRDDQVSAIPMTSAGASTSQTRLAEAGSQAKERHRYRLNTNPGGEGRASAAPPPATNDPTTQTSDYP
jgi:hypothetical protein